MAKMLSGIGSLSQLSDIRAEFNAKTVLLVTGKASYSKSGAKSIVEAALREDFVVRFNDFDVNPKIQDAERGVALAIEAGVDLIVAVGGGSVMDMAKLIKAFYTAPKKSKELAMGKLAMTDPEIPMIWSPQRLVLGVKRRILQSFTLALINTLSPLSFYCLTGLFWMDL